jgi:hypothetical protein
MQPSDSNQRRSIRVPAPYRVEAVAPDRQPIEVKSAHDFSASGFRFTSGAPVPQGQVVEVRFPDIDPSFTARGHVVWCSERQGPGFEIGLHFTDDDSPEYERLWTRIREIETYRRTIEDLRGHPIPFNAALREWMAKFDSSV